MAISKEAVVVTVPADFTLSESCMELMNQLAVTIYKCAPELARSCSTDAFTCLAAFRPSLRPLCHPVLPVRALFSEALTAAELSQRGSAICHVFTRFSYMLSSACRNWPASWLKQQSEKCSARSSASRAESGDGL